MPFTKGMQKPRNGGRKKGTPNKATAARQAEIAASGLTPLELNTRKYRYYYAIIEAELAKPKPNRKVIDYAWMAGGIAARDASPYVHPKMRPTEEEQQKQVTLVQWNYTKELLDHLPSIRRGKPFHPYMPELKDVPMSNTAELEVSRDPDRPDSGGERREGATGPSDSISPSPKKHWSSD
jgi:hypothetical protein